MAEKTNKEKAAEEKVYRRHVRVWKVARWLAPLWLKNKLGFTYDIAPDSFKAPYIVLANHNSNFDSILIGMSFPQHMYFIASEQVYRSGFKSKLLRWGFEPIAKIKGASDTLAVAKALRKLRNGINVCLFPEGNRSFNGKTWPIQEATGKLVKVSGAGLVTYRLEGGYLSTPRWGKGVRKGKCRGKIVHYYTAEELKTMTPAEITKIISDDLYVDAMEQQKKETIRYVGKNKAEGMECAVCVCPKCRQIDVIRTKKDTVYCKNCGKLTDYDDYGFFDKDFQFGNVTEWDEWQTEFYKEYIASKNEEDLLFSDDDVKLSGILSTHEEKLMGTGTFKLYKNRIEFNEITIPAKEVLADSVFGRSVYCFTDKAGVHYELRPVDPEEVRNFRKYTSAFNIMYGLM